MIKTQAVAICDICGHIEKAKASTWRNETTYDIPEDWSYAASNKAVHLCPICTNRLHPIGGVKRDFPRS